MKVGWQMSGETQRAKEREYNEMTGKKTMIQTDTALHSAQTHIAIIITWADSNCPCIPQKHNTAFILCNAMQCIECNT